MHLAYEARRATHPTPMPRQNQAEHKAHRHVQTKPAEAKNRTAGAQPAARYGREQAGRECMVDRSAAFLLLPAGDRGERSSGQINST